MSTSRRAARRDVLVAAGAPASPEPGRGRDDAPTGPIHLDPGAVAGRAPGPTRAQRRTQEASGRRRSVAPRLLVVLAALVLAGTGAFAVSESDGLAAFTGDAATPAIAAPAVPGGASPAAAAPAVAPQPVPAVAGLAPAAPQQVRIPVIGSQSMLMDLGLNPDRTIEVPPLERSEIAGWYRHSPTPGENGSSVIVGHIDGGGKEGVFFRLQQMQPGQTVYVDRADGTTAEFTVTEVQNFAKDAFPTARVYDQTPDAQLRLISCGGALDREARSYEDNVVVFASLTGTSRT